MLPRETVPGSRIKRETCRGTGAGRFRTRETDAAWGVAAELGEQRSEADVTAVEALQIASLLLVGVTMALALSHALELPGKMRLPKETYMAVQTIYYPGFTYGGVAEGFALIALGVLLYLMPHEGTPFWLTLCAFTAVVGLHAIYWFVTHPVNGFWTRDLALNRAGARFFGLSAARPRDTVSWTKLRDQWEHSHVARATLAFLSLGLLAGALVAR